ncbi:hypothetical protein HYH03_013291 [Edaphochlamys debaryana]|uniref:Bardet-Biedl syndrome 9 n=1 Tax=Edaphochlamys debaryana TaxID=47281 RepID=A0A835XQ24_9CHLO|nr:hypothetical protein HYH03_013291 [Edaphochlamys debaryana]|eukprot:KAG2488148.1 hypothetical protein HYH03_013291 [Edaphochlamys debaryana]
MSLFKARDWWHVQCGHGEEFDMGCLLVANIDNDPSGQAKIVTGSFAGFLRVYLPRDRGYKAEDLLLETELEGGPVLGLAAGRFTGSGGLQMAVLHPRKLTVYNLQAQGGGSYMQLVRLYEHYLEHTAANMCYGPFGGVQGCDYLCVQSYDGQLYFLEAEALAFTRYLPNFLVPGPLAYVDVSDTFVTCTAAMELEAYKYKVVAAASGEKSSQAANTLGSPPHPTSNNPGTKKMQADWKVVLGESAIDIRVGRFSQGLASHQADIIVLGEHTLFVLSSAGQITFQKRLEYHPACCCLYPVPGAKTPGGPENLLVATHTKALLVYRTTVLSWAAKADAQPCALAVAELPSMRGAVVALDDEGRLAVLYMGTDPLLNPVGFTETKDLDYEAMAREHRALARVIRDHGGGAGGTRLVDPADKLMMRAQIPQRLDAPRGGPGGLGAPDGGDGLGDLSSLGGVADGKRLTVRLYIALMGGSGADNLTLSVTAPEPLTPLAPEIYVPVVSTNPSDPTVVLVTLATGTGSLPVSATALVVATYNTPAGEPRSQRIPGEPRSQRLDLALPLCAFCTVVPPVKSAEFKVTLSTNRPPPPLGSVFEDALAAAAPGVAQALSGGGGMTSGGGAAGSSASVLSFQFYGGAGEVTILVSKAGGRYRIQSNVLESMWLVAKELAQRLSRYYAESEAGLPSPPEGPFAVSYEDNLPLDDFFEVVEQHFAARLRVAELRQALEDRAVQFRNIEKRLLMRFKDKSPAPLNELDAMMNETYTSLMELAGSMEEAQAAVSTAARRLGGCVQLLLLLVRWRFGLSDPEFMVLKGCIPAEIHDGSDVGWEETTEAAMTHLLRTSLAKNAKEQAVQVAPLAPAKDTQRLRKHVSLVLERMGRGMRLLSANDAAAAVAELAEAQAAASAAPSAGGGGGRPLYREPPPLAEEPPLPAPGLAVVMEEDDGGINNGGGGGGGSFARGGSFGGGGGGSFGGGMGEAAGGMMMGAAAGMAAGAVYGGGEDEIAAAVYGSGGGEGPTQYAGGLDSAYLDQVPYGGEYDGNGGAGTNEVIYGGNGVGDGGGGGFYTPAEEVDGMGAGNGNYGGNADVLTL